LEGEGGHGGGGAMPNRRLYARIGDVDEVKRDVREIKENHLPHLQSRLSKIQGELYIIIPLIIAILSLVIYTVLD
jgi:hypothetical protein